VVAIIGDAAIRLRPEAGTFATEADTQVSDKLPGVAKKAAGLFVAAFAAVKIGGFLKDAVGQASDLGESASKVGVVFGGMSQQVKDFAHSAASTMGLSNQQALEATGTFGNLAVSLGLSQKQSAGMSMNMVKLAGDLASFNNVDPQVALDALRSGLTGETEPLKQFGINMNDATLKAQAMKLGLDTHGPTLSAAVKAQAAYSLILAQSGTAQGDFARTSGGLANQQRIIAAQFLDVKANIGGAFLPFVNLAANGISGLLMPALLTVTSYMSDFGTAAGNAMSDVASYFHVGLNDVDASTVAFDTSFQRLGFNIGKVSLAAIGYWSTFTDAFKGGGLGILATEASFAGFLGRFGSELRGLSVQAQGTWSTIVTSAGTQLTGLRATVEPALLPVKAALGNLFSGAGMTGSGTGFVGFLSGILAQVGPLVTGLIDKIGPMLQTIMPLIGSTLAGLVPVVQQVFAAIGPLFGQLAPVIGALLPVIEQVAGIWRGVFMGALQALMPVLPIIVGGLGQLVGILASAFIPIITQLAPIISTLVTVFMQVATIVAGALTAALRVLLPIFPVLVTVIGQVVGMVGGALASVLQAIIPILPPIIAAFAQIAQVLLGALMGALQAILPLIPTLVGVLVLLITQAVLPLLPILPLLANLLSTIISAIAPLIPVVIQIVVLLVQLAVAAIVPLLPIIVIAANLFTMLVGVLIPIIQVVVAVAGAFIGFAAVVIGSVVRFVSTVVGIYISLYSSIASIFGSIFGVIRGIWMSIFGFVSGIVSSIAGTISGVFMGVGRAISGVFSGIGGAVSGVFSDAVAVVKGVVNSIIGIINTAIGFINHNLIDIANKVPFTSIPHIPNVPKLHSGGIFDSGNPAGEGLALLRDAELVATPEQQLIANNLLRDLLGGRLTGDTTTTTTNAGSHITINEHVHAAPGQPVSAIAAQVTQGVVWNLNGGITRPAPSTETAGANA
jgi:phage-related protein